MPFVGGGDTSAFARAHISNKCAPIMGASVQCKGSCLLVPRHKGYWHRISCFCPTICFTDRSTSPSGEAHGLCVRFPRSSTPPSILFFQD